MGTILGNPAIVGGGARLNIDYGSTPPEDTAKLWIPLAVKPDNVECSPILNYGSEYLSEYSELTALGDSGFGTFFKIGNVVYTQVSSSYFGSVDLETNTVNTKVDYKTLLNVSSISSGCMFCQHNDKVYFVANAVTLSGNLTATNYSVFEYDIPTATTSVICALPFDSSLYINEASEIARMAIQYVGGKLYLFGGKHYTYANMTNKIKIIDLSTKTATTSSVTLSNAISGAPTVVVGTKVYIFGGLTAESTTSNVIDVYDTATDTISKSIATYPLPTGNNRITGQALLSYGKYIYCFGGGGLVNVGYLYSAFQNTIYKFDTETNSFEKLPITLNSTAGYALPVKLNDKKYCLVTVYNYASSKFKQNFTIDTQLDSNNLFIQGDFGYDGLWQVINSKTASIKVKVISVYLGDSNNIAQPTNAYLYDTASSQWKSLSGESYVADMLNALNVLGVT